MADQIPLRIVTVSGQPFIGEFQSGDTVGVVHGGTGASSIAGLKTALDYNLTGLDDVAVGFPDALSANQIIVWNGTAWVNEYNDKTTLRVRNNNEVAMSRGDVIAVESAQNANLINVILADASQTSAMPAIGILDQDLEVGEEGIAITFGKVQGVNTSGLAEGEIVYVSPTTPGRVTDIRPTHDHYLIQNIGIVMRTNTNNGVIKVTGVGRSNDIPNANITTASGDADYIYIDDGGVFKKITPTNLGVGSGGGGGGVTDHGALTGLADNDHPQYVLSATNNTLSSNVSNHIASGSVHFTEASIDHGSIAGLGDNDHPQYVLSATNNNLSSLVTSVETSTTNLSSVLGSHIASGSVHFTEASIDHGSIAGLADDDHTQYARVDGTRNLQTQTISDTYTGTVGDTSIGYGIETTGNLTNKSGNYILFSATTGYQFRQDGLTTYTNTSLPDTMRNWDSAYSQLNTSFYPSFIQLKEAVGGQNINQASKQYVQFDTVDNSGGAAATDFTHNGSDTITINTAGTYEITVNLSVSAQGTTTTNQRTCQNIRIEKGGTDIGPMLATGYIRITTQHETTSYHMAPYTMTLAATDVLKLGSTRENNQTGGVGTMGEMCFWTIRRIL